jgi:hypothetical protein
MRIADVDVGDDFIWAEPVEAQTRLWFFRREQGFIRTPVPCSMVTLFGCVQFDCQMKSPEGIKIAAGKWITMRPRYNNLNWKHSLHRPIYLGLPVSAWGAAASLSRIFYRDLNLGNPLAEDLMQKHERTIADDPRNPPQPKKAKRFTLIPRSGKPDEGAAYDRVEVDPQASEDPSTQDLGSPIR